MYHHVFAAVITFDNSPTVLLEADVAGNKEPGPVVSYSGHAEPAGDVECISIWDITVDYLEKKNKSSKYDYDKQVKNKTDMKYYNLFTLCIKVQNTIITLHPCSC